MNELNKIFTNTLTHCASSQYSGWDPYDGLNSKVFDHTPLKYSAFFKIAWIQFFKHSPINLRKIMLVEKGQNPKGLALVLTSLCNFYECATENNLDDIGDWDLPKIRLEIDYIIKCLKELRSPNQKYYCWGYNFPWQSRAFFLPRWCPTIVATSFVTDALLKAYEITQQAELLDIAISSTKFVMEDLNKIPHGNGVGYSYSPIDDRLVFNATLLGSRLLANVYKYTQDDELRFNAKQSIESMLPAYNSDGSIDHSIQVGNSWRDSFHTGFKLESLARYQEYTCDNAYQGIIDKGMEYWLENFFEENGTCHYFDNGTYPLDIHCPGQFFATLHYLNTASSNKMADAVYKWMLTTFYSNDTKEFIFQKKSKYEIKIPYMRWGQCWAIYGLSFYMLLKNKEKNACTN